MKLIANLWLIFFVVLAKTNAQEPSFLPPIKNTYHLDYSNLVDAQLEKKEINRLLKELPEDIIYLKSQVRKLKRLKRTLNIINILRLYADCISKKETQLLRLTIEKRIISRTISLLTNG
ncbi:MAG: hypothetical protein P4L22_05185 [Candidatus Babeliales bacterium]|nr:hypothetical protein [Candidatus Babeliales bacterium]